MDKLRTYLNQLPGGEQDALARRAGTTIGYLRKAISAKQSLRPEVCVCLEAETKGAVRRWDLRPHDWRLIWPELIGVKGAPRAQTRQAA